MYRFVCLLPLLLSTIAGTGRLTTATVDSDTDTVSSTTTTTTSSSTTTTTNPSSTAPTPTPTTSSFIAQRTQNLHLCTDVKPSFLSSRNGRFQRLECLVRLCNDRGETVEWTTSTGPQINQPLFEWSTPLGRLRKDNGTCATSRQYCWSAVEVDVFYTTYRMASNGFREMRITCGASDAYITPDNGHTDLVVETAYGFSYLKRFPGQPIDASCITDSDCGENMFCMRTERNSEDIGDDNDLGTVCQCRMDYLLGVQYAQVMDPDYGEWQCLAPKMLNETCAQDAQCQAIDANTVCTGKRDDNNQMANKTCQCDTNLVHFKSSCQPPQPPALSVPKPQETTEKTTIIWWIFPDGSDDNDSDNQNRPVYHRRYWWLRFAAYVMAILAIILPLLLVIMALVALCNRRRRRQLSSSSPFTTTMSANKNGGSGGGGNNSIPRFPAPRIIINDLKDTLKNNKNKSDDKYDLVKHDHLSN
ncbi:uncharacterized protein LOC128955140 [Oppia nitens]|uniref:uncharacterized protein LOC128955140 n=1 Tax=Oppia nitens TaxID=1686743 RepID=UPI0023DC1E2E|nr:uncharacterized protein LOC128955140 [Oppia nitens]